MSDYLPEIISSIAIISLIVLSLFAACKFLTKLDEKRWNDGHCDVCGGTWKYEQAVGHHTSTSYIYVCGDCGKRIEVFEVR